MTLSIKETRQIPANRIRDQVCKARPSVNIEIKQQAKHPNYPENPNYPTVFELLKKNFSNLKTFIKSAWENRQDLFTLLFNLPGSGRNYVQWIGDITPTDHMRHIFMPFGTHYIAPYNSYKELFCLSKGDSTGLKLGKYKNNGKEYEVYLFTPKIGPFYDQFSNIVGRKGLLGSPDSECWQHVNSLIDRKDFLTPGAVQGNESKITEILKRKTVEFEKELSNSPSNQKFDLKKKSKEAIVEALSECILGKISKKYWDHIVDDFAQSTERLFWRKLFLPIQLPPAFSSSTRTGLKALNDLDHISLVILEDRLKELEHRKPENLLDILALESGRIINNPDNEAKHKEGILRMAKVFLELVSAAHASNINSKGFFDYEALINKDFRAGLVHAIDNLGTNSLEEMVQKVLKNPELLKPFEAAAYASFAHNTAIPAFTRQADFYLVSKDSEGKEEKKLMTEAERQDFASSSNNLLAQIPQHGQIVFPLLGYASIELKNNGFLDKNNELNSKTIFQNSSAETLKNIANSISFGQGQRKCVGSVPSLSLIKWGAFFTSYLLWKFPNLVLAKESKTKLSNLYGKEKVIAKLI